MILDSDTSSDASAMKISFFLTINSLATFNIFYEQLQLTDKSPPIRLISCFLAACCLDCIHLSW